MSNKIQKILFSTFLVLLILNPGQMVIRASDEQRLIPFIGMVLEYYTNAYTKYSGPNNQTLEVYTPVNWTIHYDQFNESTTDIFISKLLIRVNPFSSLLFENENGTIIENITNRQVKSVDVEGTEILAGLYDTYYSPSVPNYTPFYVDTSTLKVGNKINIYNYSMDVISQDRVPISLRDRDLGYRDIWEVRFKQNLSIVHHNIVLNYDGKTGILVGARLRADWIYGSGRHVYNIDIKLIIRRTNALTQEKMVLNTNHILILTVALIPIVVIFAKLLTIKEVEGGL